MKSPDRERRDWSLLIFILPVGIFLMLLVGQLAIRILPFWSVNAGMNSNLNPDTESPRPFSLFQPILPQILTPMAWAGTYLTPSGNISFPPTFVFKPGTPNSPTPVSPTPTVPTPTKTATTTSLPPTVPTNSPPVIITTKPPTAVPPTGSPTNEPTPTAVPPTGSPTTKPPTAVPPTGSPTTKPPTAVPPTVSPTNEPTQEPTEEPTPTPPPGTYVPPPGNVVGNPDGNSWYMSNGGYTVIDLGTNPIIVNGPSDTNYDLVYYENQNEFGNIWMDQIIIGISQFSNGGSFYVVFFWGDGIPDNNSNVGDVAANAGAEVDNFEIEASELHGVPPTQTGILIDVDNAVSAPPIGIYRYIVIQVPVLPGGDGNAGFDSIDIVNEPR